MAYLLQGGVDRLPTGSDFLSVMRGHGGVSLREGVNRLSEVHHCAFYTKGRGTVVVPSDRFW